MNINIQKAGNGWIVNMSPYHGAALCATEVSQVQFPKPMVFKTIEEVFAYVREVDAEANGPIKTDASANDDHEPLAPGYLT